MPTITELPSDAVEPIEPINDDLYDSDHLLQPVENDGWHYDWWTDDTPAASDSTIQRDAGREVLEARIANEREQYQPSAAEKIFAIIKSMLLRAMVIYFFMQFFKRPQPNHQTSDPEED